MDPTHPKSMLYKPVYLKPKPRELRVEPLEGRPPPVPPPAYWGVPTLQPPPPSPEPGVERREESMSEFEVQDENLERLPMLIASYKIVVPAEATRDVLAGRVPYILVDNEGMTVFKPVHVFAALKLKKKTIHRLEDYASVGAHERILDSKPITRVGLGYRRKYISPELVGRGIYHPIEPIFRLEDYGAEAVKKQLAMRRLLQTKTLYKPKPFNPEELGRSIFIVTHTSQSITSGVWHLSTTATIASTNGSICGQVNRLMSRPSYEPVEV